jgi:hypothetical protein
MNYYSVSLKAYIYSIKIVYIQEQLFGFLEGIFIRLK